MNTCPATTLTIEGLLRAASCHLNLFIPLLILAATAFFLWGVIKYITAGGNEEKLGEARTMIIWGILFLAAMVAVWGFVNVIINFIFSTNTIPKIPGTNIVKPL